MRYLVDVEKVETVIVESVMADIVIKSGEELALYAEAVPILKNENRELFVTTRFSCEVSKFSKIQEETSSIELICPESVQRIHVLTASGNVSVFGVRLRELFVGKMFGRTTLRECSVRNLSVKTVSGILEMREVYSENGVVEVVSGNITCEEIRGKSWEMITTAGDVRLVFREVPDLRVRFETASGKFSSNAPYLLEGNEMVFGLGNCFVLVKTSSGDLRVEVVRPRDKLIERVLRMFSEGKISRETAERLLHEMRGD